VIDFQALIDEIPQPPHPNTETDEVRELATFLYAAPLANGIHSGLRQMAPLLAQAILNWQAGWIYDIQQGYWAELSEAGPQGTAEIAPPQDPKFEALDDAQKQKAIDALERFVATQKAKMQ
jgi:hypothetical protein